MFNQHISKMLDVCCEELLQSSDKEIQSAIKEVKKNLPADEVDMFMRMFVKICISAVLKEEVPDSEMPNFVANHLHHSIKGLIEYKKSYIIKVELEGLEDKYYRTMEVPSSITVADLAYAVLATFKAEASHLFLVEHKDVQFVCEYDENDEGHPYASMVPLIALELRKRSKLKVWYDFGDDFIFNLEVLEVKKNADMTDIEAFEIIDGKGFAIWDDEHYIMDLYYHNKPAFDAFLEENGLTESMFVDDLSFELEESNEDFFEDFWDIKETYEGSFEETGEETLN